MKTKSKSRENFKKFSAPFLEQKLNGEIKTVNEGLLKYYNSIGHHNLKSFEQWKSEGYRVKKGAVSFKLYAHPETITIKDGNEDKQISFFPLIHLYSEKQVFNPYNEK